MLKRTMSYKEINETVDVFLEALEVKGTNDYTTLKTILNKLKDRLYYNDKYEESRNKHFEHYRKVEETRKINEIKGELTKRGLEEYIEEAIKEYKKYNYFNMNNIDDFILVMEQEKHDKNLNRIKELEEELAVLQEKVYGTDLPF